MKPYTEIGELRTFDKGVDPSELKWHWDQEDRLITPMHETDWQFQYDDRLPEPLEHDVSLYIPAGQYHRLHKGSTSLTLRVIKYETPRNNSGVAELGAGADR